MHPSEVLIRPITTEKSNQLRETSGHYGFIVKLKATKPEIAKAVADAFSVNVKSVQTVTGRTKAKRRRQGITRTKLYKKAFVKLAEGQKISVFEVK